MRSAAPSPAPTAAVAARAAAGFDAALARLAEYVAIPAISCDPAHADDVRRLAAKVVADLSALGLENSRLLELDGALPCVAAEWTGAGPDKPTVLVYGHLDLQPVKGEPWRTDPHTLTVIDGRAYARGASDDMGGWVSHLAAIQAYMDENGALPVNLRLLIEGEEEIGSPNLERFMDAYPEAFAADLMILTDCENPSTTQPGLTVSLRGLLEVELRCAALEADGHSGLWGGMVPDVSLALMALISRLADEDGRMKVGRVDVPAAWSAAAWGVPLNAAVIHEGAHLLPDVAALPDRGRPPAEWMWRQPSLTVVATTLPTPDRKKNALRTAASATLSIRLAPGQTIDEMMEALRAVLLVDPPGGVQVSVEVGANASEGWLYTPRGPAFEAADRAYMASWGAPMLQVGVGGSIPFVALFGRRYGALPLILNGVMDPNSTAHGPNESLDLGVFARAIAANVHLYAELSALSPAALRS